MVEYLGRRYDLDAVVFREQGAPDPRAPRLRELARRIHVVELPFHPRDQWSRTLRNLVRLGRGVPPLFERFSGFEERIAPFLEGRRYEVVVAEHFWCASYAPMLRRVAGRLVADLHNVESVLHARCAASEGRLVRWLHRSFARACRRLEARWLPCFDILLVASQADAAQLGHAQVEDRTHVYPNVIPFQPLPARTRGEVVALSGNLEYHPNVTSVKYFRAKIWPVLRHRWPRLVWRLVGKNPEAVRRYVRDDPRIELTGPVEDAVAELGAAKVAVVPLLAGSGTRLKVLEAWAAGTPVVSTPIGAEGLPARDGEHILVAGTAAEFADCVSALLGSEALRETIGSGGRRLYAQQFTWEAGWKNLTNLGF